MRQERTKKNLDRAQDKLQHAQDKLKRAEDKQDQAEAKAKARNLDLKPGQSKKLIAAVEEEQKNVEKAEKELAKARTKHARARGNSVSAASELESAASSVDISSLDAQAAGAAIQTALAENAAVTVTGEMQTSNSPLRLELTPGMTVLWQASLTANGSQPAVTLLRASDTVSGEKLPAPVFCISEGGLIANDGEGGRGIECEEVTIQLEGGSVRSARGDGIRTGGTVAIRSGVIAAQGTGGVPGTAIQAAAVKLEGGFVLGRAPKKSDA